MPKRVSSIRTLKRKADTLFSKYIRRSGRCAKCGSTHKKLDCSHVIPRGNFTLRYHPYNAIPLCHACHRFWWHSNPLDATEWFKQKYPDRYEYLIKHKNKITKLTRDDYEDLIKLLLDKLE